MKKNPKVEGLGIPCLKKLLRIMRLITFLIFVTTLHVSASVYSQETKLTLNLNDVSIEQVLKQIEAQSEFKFLVQDERLDVNRKVNINVRKESVQSILKQLFGERGVDYVITDKNLVILNPAVKEQTSSAKGQQESSIKGKVTDSSGSPLPGVTIVIKGTTTGTVTDTNGKYTMANVSKGSVLQFSFVGMAPQEVTVGDQKEINITMKESAVGLQEVVAVGFGSQKKVNLTGAVGTVDNKLIAQRPVQNAVQALQGVVPGLNITQNNGNMDSNPTINIRGVATIGKGSTGSPLVLIDGMEGDINSINPQDIANISVLKDAAASSIYGSRAAFGVILVTTKKGKAGKVRVNYNNSFRWNKPVLLPQMMNSYSFALYFNDANENSGGGPIFSDTRLQRIKDYQDGKITTSTIPNPNNPQYWADGYGYGNANVDWYKAVYRSSAPSQEHELSVTGGNDKVNYYLSTDYLDQTGLMRFGSDHFNRYTATSKINAKLSDKVSLAYNVRFIREEYARPARLTNSLNSDLARQGWPVLPLYDPNGYLYSSPSPALGLRDGGRDKYQNDWLYNQLNLTITPVKGWKIYANLNYRIKDNFRHWDVQKTYNHDVEGNPVPYDRGSQVHEEAYRSNYFTPNIYSDYTKQIGKNHFKVMAGFQSELFKDRGLNATRQGIIIPALPVLDLTSGADWQNNIQPPTVGGDYQQWATAGFFGRLNYNYDGKYLVEGNLRYDGTSRYRGNNRWNLFPSVSAGWNIAKENFWGSLKDHINTFKLRGSYGELGNQNTDNWYPTYETMPVGISNGTWLINDKQPNTASAPGLISSTLTWERVKTWDAGLDISAFNNRLTGSFDYFVRYTNDMVGPAPELPAILGTAVPNTNNTDLKTYGKEMDISWNDRLHNGLGYTIHLILSDSQTKITKYPNPTGRLDTYRAGEMLGEIWGYKTIGIAKTQDEMDKHLASLPNGGQNALGNNWAAGDIMYADLNNDGKIDGGSNTVNDPGDRKIIGNSTPRYNFGIDLSADWKGFDFRAFFQGVLKRDYYQNSYFFWGAWDWGEWWSTGLKQHLDYFRNDPNSPLGENLNAYYPRPLFNGKNHQAQTRYLQNAAYIRLKNIQLGYTIPKTLTQQYGIQKLRVYVSGENLWTGTKLAKMFDPETIDGGWGGNVYPLSKVISAGLSVNF
ncbi:SusC/RagA family TonB-linked outer membrane protein [Prolixibacter bellariivorans]|uniref:SusC/RagA family TonB-linked outer membrane protein n=1 Tax=Prolixibacter bellariivorans TaxID=314319 RepID=A0A5M4AVB8_9BACT|nr:TonB-dependent receptor [Prolixibacter bellariivorans]GET31491.1 SusC/RagA family TonB-linked outer membrane protein [Prolixibacter bellariivorans]